MVEKNGILSGFLPALKQQLAESVTEVTGEVENALHRQMENTGSKKKQARQLNAVSKGSAKYMSKVHRAFVKNFDKFELYVRRNIVSVPEPLTDQVARLRTEKHRKDGSIEPGNPEQEDTSLLTEEEKEERRVDAQLETLRLRLRELTASNQRLELEQKALDERTRHFQGLVTKVAFLDDVPERAVSPLKRTAEHISALRDSFLQMDSIQTALEEDTRQFKKAKVATRGAFRNLRTRFTARASEMTYRTTEDLQELRSKLLSM